MTEIASYIILLAMLFSLAGGAYAIFALLGSPSKYEKAASASGKFLLVTSFTLVLASVLLMTALIRCDFSFEYVASYTDRELPLFYRITAFWAGQAGSFLFWALVTALCGASFILGKRFASLASETKLWFILIFLTGMTFFCLMMTGTNSPFLPMDPPAADGRGMNPMLQNPGMIFHPPLLFLGYAFFAVPGMIALACMLNENETKVWYTAARPYSLLAWLFLTAGIILGAWWAYMELGWGGYWAWDPVENASVLPWLFGTAALHLGLLESRRQKGRRVHAFFMSMTTVSAFFATWLVRGNVVQSVHAYAESGVGPILLAFVLAFAVFCCFACFRRRAEGEELAGLETREGFIVMTAVVTTTLGIIIMLATLWPVFTPLWSGKSSGLDAAFYNRVCLPILAVLLGLLALCPRMDWNGHIRGIKKALILAALFFAAMFGAWSLGVTAPLPMLACGLAAAVLAAMALLIWERGASLMSIAIHAGFALCAIGVAFSGPYSKEADVTLARGASTEIGSYEVKLQELYEGESRAGGFRFLEAELSLSKGGREIGITAPQRRIYAKYPQNAYSEAATYFSLGDEFYATFLGIDEQDRAVLKISVHPLVNWIWIGGIVMCIAPLLSVAGVGRRRKKD